jgi:hypothetical protein
MAELAVKDGVQPPLVRLLAAVANAAAVLADPDQVVITACIDGQHSSESLHYALRAIDIRSKTFPSMAAKQMFINAVLRRLGRPGEYQMLLEKAGTDNEHFHLEFDP